MNAARTPEKIKEKGNELEISLSTFQSDRSQIKHPPRHPEE
jgi:hypothetical protein